MDASDETGAMGQRYFQQWADAMRRLAPTPSAADPFGMGRVLDGWSGLAGVSGAVPAAPVPGMQWLGQLEQLAAQFSGRAHTAADVGAAWRKAAGNPFAALFPDMGAAFGAPGQAGAPWLQAVRSGQHEMAALLALPAFGFTREHQERAQAIAAATLDLQQAQQEYSAVVAQASQDAFANFEAGLARHDAPGQQLASVRALFGAWVDAAEDAWATLALSPEYRRAFAALTNAQMRLRGAVQAATEQAAEALGVPGRGELDSAHRKIADLERQLRRLQRAVQDAAPAPAEPAPPASSAPPPATGSKPAAPSARPSTRGPVPADASARATGGSANRKPAGQSTRTDDRKPASNAPARKPARSSPASPPSPPPPSPAPSKSRSQASSRTKSPDPSGGGAKRKR